MKTLVHTSFFRYICWSRFPATGLPSHRLNILTTLLGFANIFCKGTALFCVPLGYMEERWFPHSLPIQCAAKLVDLCQSDRWEMASLRSFNLHFFVDHLSNGDGPFAFPFL